MNVQTANTPATPVIDTPRLRLRPFREDDLDRLFECARDPVIGDRAGWKPHATREESETVLHEVFIDKETTWAIELRESGMFIGTVGLIPDPKRENTGLRMIGYWLDRPYWGCGFMCEAATAALDHAFRILRMTAVTATCYPDNDRSRNLLLRLGFVEEGMLHMADKDRHGNLRDLLSFILAYEDYANHNKCLEI